jgi:membrane associated rhomboid family serine protease
MSAASPSGVGRPVAPTDDAGGGHVIRFPVITPTLIAAGTVLFIVLPGSAVDRLSDLSLDHPGLPDLIRVTVVRSLLHANLHHLVMTALTLGVLGFGLEPRIGPARTLAALFLGSVVASLTGLNLLLSQVEMVDNASQVLRWPPDGGTGAAVALMGLWAAGGDRSGRRAASPPGGRPSLPWALGIGVPLLAGLLFMGDFIDHGAPLTGPGGLAAYGGHVGGFLSGWALAAVLASLEAVDNRRPAAGRECPRPSPAGCEPIRRCTA